MSDAEPPAIGAGMVAIVATAVAASLVIAVVFGLLQAWPLVLFVTFAVAVLVGIPLFLVIRRLRRHRMTVVLASGFATGALLPLLLTLFGPSADQASVEGVATMANGSFTAAGYLQMAVLCGAFGLPGCLSALAAWRLSAWLSVSSATVDQSRFLTIGAATGVLAASSLGVAWLHADRSCHNPLRDGSTSIASVASIYLTLSERDWPEVDAVLKTFARERGWSVQTVQQPNTPFPWFQQNLCTDAGTQILVLHSGSSSELAMQVYQPQGGKEWQAPLQELERRLRTRWPGVVRYKYGPYAAPRPPWAPPAPTPAPSSAAR